MVTVDWRVEVASANHSYDFPRKLIDQHWTFLKKKLTLLSQRLKSNMDTIKSQQCLNVVWGTLSWSLSLKEINMDECEFFSMHSLY